MKLLIRYLKPMGGFMLVNLTIKMLATLVELVIPYILSHIIDVVVPTASVIAILFWGGMMILCAALAWIGNTTANRMAARTARNMTEKVRHDLFEKTMRMTCHASDKITIPSLESRLTSDTYNLHNFVGMMQRIGVRAPLLLVGGMIITLALDARLALIMLATLPVMFTVVIFISKKGIPLYTGVQKKVDGMVRVVREDAQGIRVIKALSKKDYERTRFDAANRDLVQTEKRVGYIMSASNPIMQICLNLGLVGVVLLGAYLVDGGISEAGKIIGFQQYFTLISTAMMTMTRIFTMYSKGIASANRIAEVLDAEDDILPHKKSDFPYVRDTSHICFDHVSFSYGKNKRTVKDVSFAIQKGQTLGIIGATGSGKTTLIQLLMRFYDVSEGAIRIGGEDIRTIDGDTLHRKFGVALQNDFLYADTIANNIDFGRGLSPEQIKDAAIRAQAIEFIQAFPEGFDHEITSKGTNISGGQKQRLLIARALAGNPEILILDDSSSALDYKTDLELRRAIAEIGGETTVIVVAQRISSVMNSDLILVLDEGEVIGAGTHGELLETCEIYREISESQMGGAFVE